MGRGKSKGGEREAAGDGKGQNPGEWGETLGDARPPEWTLSPTEWNGRRGGRKTSRVEENPGRGRQGVGGGVELSLDDLTRHREGGGVELSQDDSTPNGGGGGVESW